uniref:Uncharacterized protein n=1 Tax=Megaselia scalaris TaxID=36166 RepID=T1GYW5_MEGSC
MKNHMKTTHEMYTLSTSASKDSSPVVQSDLNGSDSDDQMDTSLMEPQLMLDEYDEPVEFKYDPNTDQQDNGNYIQQQSQYKLMMAAAQQRQLEQLQQLQAVAKGGAIIGVGPQPGTVTISNASNSLVSIPKLTPILSKTLKQCQSYQNVQN